MKKGVGSGVGSGSKSQRYGSGDPDPDPGPYQNVTDPQHSYTVSLRLVFLLQLFPPLTIRVLYSRVL
jgi:hypothetical protein